MVKRFEKTPEKSRKDKDVLSSKDRNSKKVAKLDDLQRGRIFSADDQSLAQFLSPDFHKNKQEEAKELIKKDVWSLPFANLAATALIKPKKKQKPF